MASLYHKICLYAYYLGNQILGYWSLMEPLFITSDSLDISFSVKRGFERDVEFRAIMGGFEPNVAKTKSSICGWF